MTRHKGFCRGPGYPRSVWQARGAYNWERFWGPRSWGRVLDLFDTYIPNVTEAS